MRLQATANGDCFADVGGEAYVNDHYRSAKKNYASRVATASRERGRQRLEAARDADVTTYAHRSLSYAVQLNCY